MIYFIVGEITNKPVRKFEVHRELSRIDRVIDNF